MQKTFEVGGEVNRSHCYADQLPQTLFGMLVKLSQHVVQYYQSDWYHDALFLKKVTDEYSQLKGEKSPLILDYFYRDTGTHLHEYDAWYSSMYAQYNDYGIRVKIAPKSPTLPDYYTVTFTRLLITQGDRGSKVHAKF